MTPFPGSRWQTVPAAAHSIAWLIAGFTLLRLLLAATVPLLPQEAYYWSWSQHLDWSYFDHPPLVSYSMALTTALLGSTAFGIKAAAVLWSLGWNIAWAKVVLDMYADRRLAFWSLATLNLTLIFEAFGIGPTPDAPLIFAWAATIWAVWRVSQSGDGRRWFVAGAFVGLSWLGKYSGVLLLPVILLYLLTSAQQRRWLFKPQPYLAVVLAALVFTPVLLWNAQHEWVSLAFQSTHRVAGMGGFQPRYFALLVATQFLLLTPYVFVLCIGALFRGLREWFTTGLDDRTRLLLLSAAVPVVLFSVVSLRSLAKPNWLAPAYGSLIILGVQHLLAREGGSRRLLRGLASSAAILLIAGIALAIPNLPLPRGMNSWSGWDVAAVRVDRVIAAARADGHDVFVFSPGYKISSLLRFHLSGQPRTYAQDIYGDSALQFDYFPLDRNLTGATGILVVSDDDHSAIDLGRLKAYFDACVPADAIEAMAFGEMTRRVEVFRCTNYKGHPPRSAQHAAVAD